jgi:hypothetical protein
VSSLPVTHYKKETSMQGIYQEIRKEGISIWRLQITRKPEKQLTKRQMQSKTPSTI